MELGTAALQRGQSLIAEDGLKKMGKDLVRLCDGIERHGLVDYEYGVWEESIVEGMSPLSLLHDENTKRPDITTVQFLLTR